MVGGILTNDAWLTLPPLHHAYQGQPAIGTFLCFPDTITFPRFGLPRTLQ
jgi:hypothetical protein